MTNHSLLSIFNARKIPTKNYELFELSKIFGLKSIQQKREQPQIMLVRATGWTGHSLIAIATTNSINLNFNSQPNKH